MGGAARSCPATPFPPPGIIAGIDFLTSAALARRLPTWQSFADEQLLCVVSIRYPDRDRSVAVIFDAHTGRGAGRSDGESGHRPPGASPVIRRVRGRNRAPTGALHG